MQAASSSRDPRRRPRAPYPPARQHGCSIHEMPPAGGGAQDEGVPPHETAPLANKGTAAAAPTPTAAHDMERDGAAQKRLFLVASNVPGKGDLIAATRPWVTVVQYDYEKDLEQDEWMERDKERQRKKQNEKQDFNTGIICRMRWNGRGKGENIIRNKEDQEESEED